MAPLIFIYSHESTSYPTAAKSYVEPVEIVQFLGREIRTFEARTVNDQLLLMHGCLLGELPGLHNKDFEDDAIRYVVIQQKNSPCVTVSQLRACDTSRGQSVLDHFPTGPIASSPHWSTGIPPTLANWFKFGLINWGIFDNYEFDSKVKEPDSKIDSRFRSKKI